jgi:hypothetical protein
VISLVKEFSRSAAAPLQLDLVKQLFDMLKRQQAPRDAGLFEAAWKLSPKLAVQTLRPETLPFNAVISCLKNCPEHIELLASINIPPESMPN